MKKLFTLLLLLASYMSAWATVFSVGDLKYETSGTAGEVWCIGLSDAGNAKSSVELSIPRQVTYSGTTYKVQRIGYQAFLGKTNITGATINYGIERINSEAFYNCSKMTWVRFPSSLTSMGTDVFYGCTRLVSVYYAGTSPKITFESSSFPSVANRTLYVPRGTKPADFRAGTYYDKSRFTQIVTSSYAWDEYMSDGTMFIVTKASTSTSTDHEATIIGFNSNGSNTGVAQGVYQPSARTWPTGQDRYFRYVAVADSAFADNTNLTSLDLTNLTYLTTFGTSAARGCTKLTTAKLAKGTIKGSAFRGCTALTSVSLSGVTSIESTAFGYCTKLTSINIPASVTNLSAYFIDGSSALTTLTVDASNTKYSASDNILYNKDKTTLMRVPEGRTSVISTPFSVTEIGPYAFESCSKVTSIDLMYGVKKIGTRAFRYCSGLTRVRIPSSVTDLGDYLFSGCSSLADLYINIYNPPTITKSAMFENAANPNLYTPRGRDTNYKNAGWTSFRNYNNSNVVAYDYVVSGGLCYTIHSTASTTLNGNSYNGRAKVVRGRNSSVITGETTIPTYIELNNKKYAVTLIEELAFNTSNSFSIKGCALVDTIGKQAFDNRKITSIELPWVSFIDEEGFDDCTTLASATWGHRLKRIEKWGFCNAPLEHNIILPVGFQYLGYQAFKQAKSKVILVPSTLISCSVSCFNWMNNLTTIIMNAPSGMFDSGASFDFGNVPSSAKVYVPVGQLARAKAHSDWKRFSNIEEGAFDFSLNGDLNSKYTMTVTSTQAVTVGNETYAGKAKYVYNPNIKSSTTFQLDNYETDNMCGIARKYLMTEIGDSAFYGSKFTAIDPTRMTRLDRIGKKAFANSQVTSVTTPDRRVTFGVDAFYGATKLSELVIQNESFAWDGRFFGNNASDFNCYVQYNVLANVLNQLSSHTYTQKCADRLAPCFKPSGTSFNLANLVPIRVDDFDKSYIIMSMNNQGRLVSRNMNGIWQENTGVILDGLTPGTLYKTPRDYAAGTSAYNNYLRANTTTSDLDIKNITDAYYWDVTNKKFVKPTSSYTVTSGRCYLVMPGGGSELYIDVMAPTGLKGDVNGDGIVDASDVTTLIQVVLGKISATSNADVNGDGVYDASDVTELIATILG